MSGAWHARALELLAGGTMPAVIAERLGVSKRAVEWLRRQTQAPDPTTDTPPIEAWPALYRAGVSLETIGRQAGQPRLAVRRELLARGVVLRAPGRARSKA